MSNITFIGRVAPIKGLDNLCKAYARINASSDWKLVIVGPDQEGHTAELRKLAVELGISNRVEFLGPKYGELLQREYTNADLFVLPSYSENFGSVVIEALAHGVPVITTKGTPWRELREYGCGWWIDVGVDPLVTALNEATSLTTEERKTMGVRGRRLVEKKYSWKSVCEKLMEVYESVINGGLQ